MSGAPEHNGFPSGDGVVLSTGAPLPAIKIEHGLDLSWKPIGDILLSQITSSEDQSAARLASRLAGVHPTAAEEVNHQIDRKLQATSRRAALEKVADEELRVHGELIHVRFEREADQRGTIYQRLLELEQLRDDLLPSFARAVSDAGVALSYDSLSPQRLEQVAERMRTPGKPWFETPVPGISGNRVKVFKLAAPLCLGASVAISVGALYSVISSSDFRGITPGTLAKLFILFLVGASLKLSGAVEAQQQGRLRATAHHEGEEGKSKQTWQEVRWRFWVLMGLWVLLSVFEGIALNTFAHEVNRFNKEVTIQPVWVYILVGGLLAGFGFRATESVAFVDGLQELRQDFNDRSVALALPSNPNLARVLSEGSYLLSLKERIVQDRRLFDTLAAQENQPPCVSERTQKLLDEAISQERAEVERLSGLVSKYAQVFTPLPHQVLPEEIVAPSPPKKVVKRRYYFWWFRWRDGKGDD